jgi:hypothetical protein
MNNNESSSTDRLIAGGRDLRGEDGLHDASSHFPSYLRFFDVFFGPLISESYWGAARLLASCCGQVSTAQAYVAFL